MAVPADNRLQTRNDLAWAISVGGIGIVNKNMPIGSQAREVARVKKFESGVIIDPITVPPETTIRQVIELTRARGISGVPVVSGSKVVGIVTHRDLRFERALDAAMIAK